MHKRYEGPLTLWTDQGMEGVHVPSVQDVRGIAKNPSYNPTSKEWPHCVPEFHDLQWTIELKTKDFLTIYEPGESSPIFHGQITKDRDAIACCDYALSFIPKEVPLSEFLGWFKRRCRAVIQREDNRPRY